MNIKKLLLVTSICLITSSCLSAKDLPLFTFSLGLTTGHIFYGEKTFDYSYKIESESNVDTDKKENNDTEVSDIPENSSENNSDNTNTSESKNTETTNPNTEEAKQTLPVKTDTTESSQESSTQTDTTNETTPSNEKEQTENEKTETISFPMTFPNGSEVLIGITGTACLNLTNQFSLYTDIDCTGDFNWLGTDYSHHLDYSIAAGAKIYVIPNIKAISVSIAYLWGSRVDFLKYENFKYVKTNPFGNGIKISAEYNFSRDGEYRFLPTVGCSWRFIPRGNYAADNIISAYAQVNF